MTIHLDDHYICTSCGYCYIPFDEEHLSCPVCEHRADKAMGGFLEKVYRAAKENIRWGVFRPLNIADGYVMQAMRAIQELNTHGENTVSDEQVDHLIDTLTHEIVFGGKGEEKHAKGFYREIIRLEMKQTGDEEAFSA